MPIYHALGRMPSKRHIVFEKDGGGLYYEELIGNKGFVGPSSLLYHVQHPTQVRSVRLVKTLARETDPEHAFRHRHFRTARLPGSASITADRIPLLFNRGRGARLRPAVGRGRLFLSQRARRRDRLRERWRGRARDTARRAGVPTGRLPGDSARDPPSLPFHGHTRALPGDREPGLCAHADGGTGTITGS